MSVEHAYPIDKTNGNTFWRDALWTETYNVGVVFEVLDEGKKAPEKWKWVTGHLTWDAKMDFMRKA